MAAAVGRVSVLSTRVRADGDITGQHRRGRDVGRLRHLRASEPVLHEHRTTPDHRRRDRILVRTHIHHLMPFAAEHTEDIGAARSGGAAVPVQFPAQALACSVLCTCLWQRRAGEHKDGSAR